MRGWRTKKHGVQALGRSTGGFTSRLPRRGRGLHFLLTAGQDSDIGQGSALIKDFAPEFIIADKGYDSDAFVALITAQGATPVMPPRANRKILREDDKDIAKERHLVECYSNKIKHFRRVFSRFDKLARHYLSFVYLASALIWLR